jgi:hypothetical protein
MTLCGLGEGSNGVGRTSLICGRRASWSDHILKPTLKFDIHVSPLPRRYPVLSTKFDIHQLLFTPSLLFHHHEPAPHPSRMRNLFPTTRLSSRRRLPISVRIPSTCPLISRRFSRPSRAIRQTTSITVSDETFSGPRGTFFARSFKVITSPSADRPILLFVQGGGWIGGHVDK